MEFSADPYPGSGPFSPPLGWRERGIVGRLSGRRGPPAQLLLATQWLQRGYQHRAREFNRAEWSGDVLFPAESNFT